MLRTFSVYVGPRETVRNTQIPGARLTMNTRTPSRLQESKLMPVAMLGPDIQAKIGEQLRGMYAEIVNQGVPERFIGILGGRDDPTIKGSKYGPS
jgi:Anti-sigma factor NepR